jgi:hypothetical protein
MAAAQRKSGSDAILQHGDKTATGRFGGSSLMPPCSLFRNVTTDSFPPNEPLTLNQAFSG